MPCGREITKESPSRELRGLTEDTPFEKEKVKRRRFVRTAVWIGTTCAGH